MNLEQAINLIGSILTAQKLTLQEHKQVQEGWSVLLNAIQPKNQENADGNNDLHVPRAVQSSQ